jgi:hypothetical protein
MHVLELLFAAPLHVVYLRRGNSPRVFDFALGMAAGFFYQRRGRPARFVNGSRRVAPHLFHFAVSLTPRFVNLDLRRPPDLVELGVQRCLDLSDLRFRSPPDFLGLALCGLAEMCDLRFGLPADFGRGNLGRMLSCASAFFGGGPAQLVGKGGKIRVQMGTYRSRGTVERQANVFVERHGPRYCT